MFAESTIQLIRADKAQPSNSRDVLAVVKNSYGVIRYESGAHFNGDPDCNEIGWYDFDGNDLTVLWWADFPPTPADYTDTEAR